eukprot:6208237-Pleurochrysis_carterae.AAC.2
MATHPLSSLLRRRVGVHPVAGTLSRSARCTRRQRHLDAHAARQAATGDALATSHSSAFCLPRKLPRSTVQDSLSA